MATVLSDIVCAATLTAKLTKTEQGSTVQVNANQSAFSLSLSAGTVADAADQYYYETSQALSSAATADHDMYDLAVFDSTADLLGTTITNAEIVALIVRNQSSSAGNLLLGGNGTTAAWNSFLAGDDNAQVTIHPGGFFMIAAPDNPAYAVADTTNHLLRITASGGDITYDIGFLGRSA